MGIPDHLTCLLRNLFAGQEATVRTRHGTTDWFQIGKGVHQGCILSPRFRSDQSLSRVWLFATPWTAAYQAPPSTGFSRQEYRSGVPTSALLTTPKPLTVWIITSCGKFFKRWKYQTTWPASWETCMRVKKQQLELDMEQQTGSK